MKKLTAVIMAGSLILSLAACGGNPSSTTNSTPASSASASVSSADTSAFADLDPVELIVADSAAPGTAVVLFENKIAENVEAITGGKLTLDIHSNGDLGGDADLMRQVQSGDIDAVGCQIAPVVSFIPELAVFDLPMVFAKYDGDAIESVLNGDGAFRSAIDKAYEANGLHLMGFLQNATYRLTTSSVDLPDLAAYQGLNIRTMENSNHMAFWSAIGASPTPLAWAEVYFALQSGMITAEENSADTVVNANLYEVQSYLACTNHILYCNQLCLNKDTWDNLDPAYQAALEQAVEAATMDIRQQLATIDEENKAALEREGMTIIEYPTDFFDQILALDSVTELYQKIDSDTNGLGTILQTELAG